MARSGKETIRSQKEDVLLLVFGMGHSATPVVMSHHTPCGSEKDGVYEGKDRFRDGNGLEVLAYTFFEGRPVIPSQTRFLYLRE